MDKTEYKPKEMWCKISENVKKEEQTKICFPKHSSRIIKSLTKILCGF